MEMVICQDAVDRSIRHSFENIPPLSLLQLECARNERGSKLTRSPESSGAQVTLKDIAERCGVAKTTVARVLNDKPHVKPALRARVLAAATELGYNPAVHDVARRLAYRKTGRRLLHRTIGLLINDEVYRINYHARLHKGIVEEVTAQHYILLSVLFAKNDPHPAIALDRILMHGVDGLIVQPGGDLAARVQEQAQQRQHTHGCPYVISLSLDPEVDGVYADRDRGPMTPFKRCWHWDIAFSCILSLILFWKISICKIGWPGCGKPSSRPG